MATGKARSPHERSYGLRVQGCGAWGQQRRRCAPVVQRLTEKKGLIPSRDRAAHRLPTKFREAPASQKPDRRKTGAWRGWRAPCAKRRGYRRTFRVDHRRRDILHRTKARRLLWVSLHRSSLRRGANAKDDARNEDAG